MRTKKSTGKDSSGKQEDATLVLRDGRIASASAHAVELLACGRGAQALAGQSDPRVQHGAADNKHPTHLTRLDGTQIVVWLKSISLQGQQGAEEVLSFGLPAQTPTGNEPTGDANETTPGGEAGAEQLNRLRAAFEQVGEAILLIDPVSLHYLDVNRHACDMFGSTRDELMRQGPDGLKTVPPHNGKLKESYASVIRMYPKVSVRTVSYERLDGSFFLTETSRRAIRSGDQWIILVTVRDITERRQAQRRVELLAHALDQAADAIMLVDCETGDFLDVNQRACTLFGLTREELFALGPHEVSVSYLTREAYRAFCARLASDPSRLLVDEGWLVTRDGRRIALEFASRAIQSDGRWIAVVSARDMGERKAQVAQLEMFRAAIEQIDDAFSLVDPDTLQYIYVNDAACRMFGYTREEVMAGGPLLTSRLTAQALGELYRNPLDTPETARTTHSHRHKGGHEVWVESARRMMDSDSGMVVISVGRDITAARQAQARMALLASAVNLSEDAIYLIDVAAEVFVEVNDAACRLYGFTREELLGSRVMGNSAVRDIIDQLHRLYQELVAAAPHALLEETVATRADGSTFAAEHWRQAMQVEGRWIIISTTRDITERQQAQQQLQRFRMALDHTLDGVTLIDRTSMRIVDANAVACRRAGLPREQFLAQPLEDRSPSLSREVLEQAYDSVIANAPAVEVREDLYRAADGRLIPLEVSRSAFQNGSRWIIVITSHDVTERWAARAELQQRVEDLARSNQELEQFAYIASHDLSEPLRMVASYTQLLQRRYGERLDGDGQEFMGFIVDGARRMKGLIDDLLAYSRAGRPGRKAREIDLNLVMDDVLKNLERLIADKSAGVESAALPKVHGDKTSLTQVLQNLVGNALKFNTGPTPQVRIGVTSGSVMGLGGVGAAGETWTFSVADNGLGIAPKYFERIFIIFQRLNAREKYEGTGMGLAICKKIVEAHGGRIWVESQPGEGSTFFFTLPKQLVATASGNLDNSAGGTGHDNDRDHAARGDRAGARSDFHH
ncbi:MAG: PAS domain S-box protein [Bdellovibrionales bacterium]|nr:PAS domain S-box protein [Ramlibacter sp.]